MLTRKYKSISNMLIGRLLDCSFFKNHNMGLKYYLYEESYLFIGLVVTYRNIVCRRKNIGLCFLKKKSESLMLLGFYFIGPTGTFLTYLGPVYMKRYFYSPFI